MSVDTILELYAKYGTEEYDLSENITQAEHALQCASLAEADPRLSAYDRGTRTCVIVAALLHDIGHLIGIEMTSEGMTKDGAALGITGHEGLGAAYLEQCGFPPLVYRLVSLHVPAKKYLCRDPSYIQKLSAASQATLKLQGGAMDSDEAQNFRNDPLFNLALLIRDYDDNGKSTEPSRLKMEQYKSLMILAIRGAEK